MSGTDRTVVDQRGGPSLPQLRRIRTEIPGPRSRELLAAQRGALPAGVGSVLPVFVAAAGGAVVLDVDDNSFIDFGSGIAVTTVGNAAPAVVERATAALHRFTHTCFLVNPYPDYVRVCAELNRLAPIDGPARSLLVNSGAEAVENAVKIARAATGRPGIVVFDHAFHGRTLLTMSMTAKNVPYRQGFGPFAGEIHRTPMAHPYRWPGGADRCAEQAAAALVDLLDRQVGATNVAAVVIEPIQGEGGFVVPARGFLPAVARICAERDIVLIADEVQTGIGRTGDMFACQHEDIRPDLITTAKGLAGGLPLGAVTGRAELLDAVPAGGLGGTFSGNPVSCAAALGVFEEIERHDLLGAARRIESVMRPALHDLARRHTWIGDVRGRGAMLAVELVTADGAPDPARTAAVSRACHAAGLLTLTAGSYGNVLRFLPPLSISEDLLVEGLEVLSQACAQVR